MALEAGLNLNLQQRLAMTPRLQQSIQMLQMTVQELTALIEQQMLENPTLEMAERDAPAEPEADGQAGAAPDAAPASSSSAAEHSDAPEDASPGEGSIDDDAAERFDDFDWDEYFRDDSERGGEDDPAFRETREESNYENFVSRGASLQDHLIMQLRLAPLTEEEYRVGEFLIGNLDPAGYLKVSIDEAVRFLNVERSSVVRALEALQGFDPLGVAARDARECLLIQYRTHDDYEPGGLIERLIDRHLDALSEKQFKPLAKELGSTPVEVQGALDWIGANLDPRPGTRYTSDAALGYINPDVIVEKIGEDYIVQLNDAGLPRLRLSRRYRAMARDREGVPRDTRRFIREKIDAAQWLIKSIQQRRDTIFKVATAIVKFQRAFLDHGIARFRPLTMREVADEIGMHEATVSRVTTGKYMQTPRGVYELKFFFSSGLSASAAASPDAGDVSSVAVKERIRVLVAAEDPRKPVSDQKLTETLEREGITIARRTVAKYREELGIASSSKRKRYE